MNKVLVTNGCSIHSDAQREQHDYYATNPNCVKDLLQVETFNYYILEPCCGVRILSNT